MVPKFIRKKQLALHIITMNRRNKLRNLILKCNEFFDVIRICDGGSDDDTQSMAKKLGTKVFYREWDDQYHLQDNYLLRQCKDGDWVMIMDDDECPSMPLLQNLRTLISVAKREKCNMISLPSLLVLDKEPECSIDEFIQGTVDGQRDPFRKFWLFEHDYSVRSYGTPHRAVETVKGWKTYHQPYPYYHYKTSWEFVINDCIHAWINPLKQQYSREEAEEMRAALPNFRTSRNIEPWLKSDKIGNDFVVFAEKYKDSDKPIRNWWTAYQRLARGWKIF